MGDEKNIRHRFTVPKDDTQVEDWIQAQSNLGFSLRVLIRAFVRSYGYRDATCMELGTPVKRVGRPPKQAQIALGQMMEQESVPSELFPMQDSEAEEMVETLMKKEAEKPAPVRTAAGAGQASSQGNMQFGHGMSGGGSSIEGMLGLPQPTKSQMDIMDSIMNLDK